MANFTLEFSTARRFGKEDYCRTSRYLVLLSEQLGARASWEPDIENWGRVLVGDTLLALVAHRLPLIIMIGAAYPLQSEMYMRVILVDDLHQKGHRIDPDIVREVFEVSAADMTRFDFDDFSLYEFWDLTMVQV